MGNQTYIPDGWPGLIPRIAVADPAALVAFIKDVFGAKGSFNAERPTELWISNSLLMVGSTIDREPTRAFLYVYVADVDAAFRRAIAHGAKPIEEPQDMPYGDRRAMVQDEWGNRWQIATHSGRFSP
ncbi:MAG: VOC family protein [Gammaproteobacteria bacterium]